MTRSHSFAEATVHLINTRTVTKDIHWMLLSTQCSCINSYPRCPYQRPPPWYWHSIARIYQPSPADCSRRVSDASCTCKGRVTGELKATDRHRLITTP